MKHELQVFISQSTHALFPRYHGAFILPERSPEKSPESSATQPTEENIDIFNILNDFIHTSEIVLDVMQHRDQIEPLRVLGVTCNTQIPLYIVSTLFLVGFVFAQYILLGSIVF